MGVSGREEFEKWWCKKYSAYRLAPKQTLGGEILPSYIDLKADLAWQAWQAARESEGGEAVAYACHSCGDKTSPPAPFSMSVKCHCGHTTAATIAANLAKDTHLPKQQSGFPLHVLTNSLIESARCLGTADTQDSEHYWSEKVAFYRDQIYATTPQPDKWIPCSERLQSIIGNMEYAAYNLCSDMNRIEARKGRVVESTCPEASLLIAIRDLKELVDAPPEQESE